MVFGKKRIKSTVTKQTKCFKLTLRTSFIRATSCKASPFCILLGYTTDNRQEREREGEREREREREQTSVGVYKLFNYCLDSKL